MCLGSRAVGSAFAIGYGDAVDFDGPIGFKAIAPDVLSRRLAYASVTEEEIRVNTPRFPAVSKLLSVGGTRRSALRWIGLMSSAAALVRVGTRPAVATAQSNSGLSRSDATTLAEGIAAALTSDPDRLAEWVADDVVGHVPLAPDGAGKGLEGLKHKASVIIEAIPDAHITVDHLAVDGDWVVAHGEIAGTHTRSLAEISATGKKIRVQYVIFTRIVDGKVAEYWYQLDVLGALQQLDLFALDQGEDDDGGY
jgi:predicted ester cyclase